jgi:uncharacterized membrane protein YeaQ/YmgE (transglycosylase-associated protein family)
MSFLWAIIIGFVAGVLAKLLMPGKDPGGIVITTLLGIAGSVIATWIGQAAGWYGQGQGAGFIASVAGAFLVLLIYRLIIGATRPGGRGTPVHG